MEELLANDGIHASEKIYMDDDYRDPFSLLIRIFTHGYILRDRFDIINKYSPYNFTKSKDEIPKPFEEYTSFHEVADKIATEMLSKYKTIGVSWSGGVDSTTVVCVLLNNLQPSEYNRIKVICSESSIEEYPLFYRLLNRLNVPIVLTNDMVETMRNIDVDCITSGWCADQLYGHDIHQQNLSLYNKPYMEGIVAIWNQFFPNDNLSKDEIDSIDVLVKEYSSALGLNVEQFCEFAWMYNFGVKMSYVRERLPMHLFGSKNEGKVEHFYHHPLLQRWAMSNFKNIRTHNGYKDTVYYKQHAKQYILEFTHDGNYFKNKIKRNSWYMLGELKRGVYVLTDSGLKVFKAKNSNNLESIGRLVSKKFLKVC